MAKLKFFAFVQMISGLEQRNKKNSSNGLQEVRAAAKSGVFLSFTQLWKADPEGQLMVPGLNNKELKETL